MVESVVQGNAESQPSREYYLLFIDAGKSFIAAILKRHHKGRLLFVEHLKLPIESASVDQAEYRALIEGLKLAHHHRVGYVRVFTDRESIVTQMTGRKAGKSDPRLFAEAIELADKFASFKICWLPREMNTEVDALTQ